MTTSHRFALVLLFLTSLVATYAVAQPGWIVDTPVRWQYGAAPTSQPPLDSSVIYRRVLAGSEAHVNTTTHEILSLYMENASGSATMFPWPLYVELKTNHARGTDGVGITSRLRNEGTGWAAAYHAEPIITGTGTTIGLNIETTSFADAHAIGINIQTKNSYGTTPAAFSTDQAINIQSDVGQTYQQGIRFNGCATNTGVLFDATSTGGRAIHIQGHYTVGVDAGSNPIRVSAGTPIQLEASGAITVMYQSGRIIFRNRSRVLGYLVTDSTASGGRLN